MVDDLGRLHEVISALPSQYQIEKTNFFATV